MFLDYYREWLAKSFKRSWGLWDTLGTLLGAICPLLAHYVPRWESAMGRLAWEIPLSAFCGLALVRLPLAPYWIHRDNEEKRKKKEAELNFETASLVQKLSRAVAEPRGPEIMLWFSPDVVIDDASLIVENVNGGTAYRVKVHDADHFGLVLTAEEIPFIEEKTRRPCGIRIDCPTFPGERFGLRSFLNPPPSARLLPRDRQREIPILVTYKDAADKTFESRFEISYDRTNWKVSITPLGRKLTDF
jgi:hypothetical protein